MSPAASATEAAVRAACRELHLPTVGSRASQLATEAARANHSHLVYLAALLEAELEDRADRRRQRRIVEARFPRLKRLEDFNFAEAPRSPRPPSGSSRRAPSSIGPRP